MRPQEQCLKHLQGTNTDQAASFTGCITRAWPKMYWQLYDYFFAPNGAFYGTRKACEPVHIQYCYDDRSIRVVNSNYNDFAGLKATAKLYNFNMEEKYSQEVTLDIAADESKKTELPGVAGERR